MRKISIAIPTFNRYQLTIDSFAEVLNDDRVLEIIIVDDASTDGSYEKLRDYFSGNAKVKVFRNLFNRDCYQNKMTAASYTNSEFCIVFDSDNTLTPKYLDAIYAIPEWDAQTIYQPEFAKPCFDFTKYSGLTLTKENVAQYVDTNLMTALNAFNLFINRDEYLNVWDRSVNPGSSDSIYFSLCWLIAGGKIHITPNLQYDHRIHADKSNHYSQNSHKYVAFHEQVMNKIKNLS